MIRAAGLMALALLLGACSGQDHVEPPAELVDFESSLRVKNLWRRDISTLNNTHQLAFRPLVLGDTIYAAERTGMVTALDRETGARRWQQKFELSLSAGVGGDDGRLFVVSRDGVLLALSAADGSELWRTQVSTEVVVAPTAALNVVVVRSIDGRIATYDAESGGEFWSYSQKVPALTVRGNSRPFIVPGGVLVGLDTGRIAALSLDAGGLVWESRLAPPAGRSEIERLNDADAALAIDMEHIYAANYQGVVAQLDPATGRSKWTREISTVRDLHVADGIVYLTEDKGHVWALDSRSGAALWKQDKLNARYVTGATPVGDYLVVGDLEGYLHWMSRSDGRFVARTRVGQDRVLVSPLVKGDTVYALSIDGELAAFRMLPKEGD